MQQILERRTACPAREGFLDALHTLFGVAHLGHEAQGIVVATQIMVETPRIIQELLQPGEGIGPDRALGIEIVRRQARDLDRTGRSRPEAHFAASAIVEINLAVRRLKPGLQITSGGAFAFQFGQCELDVLAGAERVGGKVGAGAIIVARLRAANEDAVTALTLRVGHLEFGEDRMLADVLDKKVLLTAKLPAQLGLPLFQRHVIRFVQAG